MEDEDAPSPEVSPMTIPAPYARYEGEVLPEWIDWNGHLNLAYYVVLFDKATDILFEELGLGLSYRRDTDHGTFVAETHNRYERELLVHETVSVTTQIVASDDKRLHLAHEMFRRKDGLRAATQELMFLHVDLIARRVCPFPPALRARVDAAAASHADLPRPDWVGRRVAMPG
jgi:acyl-CoA thioester hydrolase